MKQLTIIEEIEKANKLKKAGIKKAVDHADQVNAQWSEGAYKYCLRYLQNKSTGFLFLSENIRIMAEADGFPVPPSKRAWASVILRVQKAGYIVSNGITKASNPKCHSAFVTQWKKIK